MTHPDLGGLGWDPGTLISYKLPHCFGCLPEFEDLRALVPYLPVVGGFQGLSPGTCESPVLNPTLTGSWGDLPLPWYPF